MVLCAMSEVVEPSSHQPLEKFRTLYVAADDLKQIEENGPLRIHIRHILPYNNYAEVGFTFYIMQKDRCQLYTPLLCKFITFIIRPPHKSRPLQSRSQGGDVSKTVFFMIPDKFSTLPENWVQSIKDESKVTDAIAFLLYPVSNTTVIMCMHFVEKNGKYKNMCAAFSKETSLSKELWDIYVRTTVEYGIPRENIRDILKNGFKIDTTCYIYVHGI
nr:aphrodisin-like [Peromyscus maniculatus bairdii]